MSHISQKKPFASLVDDDEPQVSSSPSPPQKRMSASDLQFCHNTMKVLKRNKRSIAFQSPVDPVKFNILDYFDVITHPMDLGTVESKLKQNEYPDIESFLADIQLIFDNCYLYNNPYDPVTLDAKKLEESFKRQLKKVPSHVHVSHLLHDEVHDQPPPVQSKPIQHVPIEYAPSQYVPVQHEPIQPEPIQHESIQPEPIQHQTIQTKPIQSPSSVTTPVAEQRPLTVKLPLPKPSNVKREGSTMMPEDQFKRCEAIVKELKKSKYLSISWPFQQPVDADAWNATDYYQIIKHPMDMSTYEKKLYNSEYLHEGELAEDIRLMFRNCYTYNPPGHEINRYGHQLEEVFEKTWEKLHQQKSSKEKKSSSSKKRRTSNKDVITNSTIVEPSHTISAPAPYQPPPPPPTPPTIKAVVSSTNDTETPNHTNNINSSTSVPGRSNILRLKLTTTKNKDDEPTITASSNTSSNTNTPTNDRFKISQTTSKPTKSPGLALSKEPPKANKAPGLALSKEPTSRPKLGIGRPPSPIKTKQEPSTVLPNHDKWMALAKNVPALPLQQKLPVNNNQRKPVDSMHTYTPMVPPPPPPAVAPAAPRISPPPPKPKEQNKGFDITELYSQIKNGARRRDQEEKERQEKFEREEKIRLENERIESERKLQRLREFNIHTRQLRIQEKEKRMIELNENPTDISKQKMMFLAFERDMTRDNDWMNILHWQRDTVNYRNIPAPGFVKRSPVKLTDLRAKLLSKCVRLENSMAVNKNNVNMDDQGDSDMDIE